MKLRPSASGGRPTAFAAISVVLLIPCFWQSRLQAGDLSSHIYNAWLARLIVEGRATGLTIARQSTNVLFDLMLGGLLPLAGWSAAQRISVAIAVLVFVWGAFAFVAAVSGRRAWNLLPILAMLAYGWVFHMGFFNFYLSLGLSFWALALCWEEIPGKMAAAIPVLAVAWLAHALPVVWAVSLVVYLWLARRLSPSQRVALLTGSAAIVIVLRIAATVWLGGRWFPGQILKVIGLDQVTVFDAKYLVVAVGLLAVWVILFTTLIRQSGARKLASGVAFHIAGLTIFGLLVLPNALLLPGYQHLLAYITERMSLVSAVCICALAAGVRGRAVSNAATGLIALVFFGFLFRDDKIFNTVEDRMSELVSQLPPGQRVISTIDAPDLRVNALGHMIDRVCVGRCFSYANYEPSTAQFRIRAAEGNRIVVSNYLDAWEIQTGTYVVRESDLPLYAIRLDANSKLMMLSLPAGTPSGATSWNPL